MIRRTDYLNDKASLILTGNMSTGKTVGEMDIDKVIEISSLMNSIGKNREEFLERRNTCLEEGLTEQDLKTIEDHMGIHNLSDRAIKNGSIEAMVKVFMFTERVIEDYRREVRVQMREKTRRIFRNR